ncbi:hypothetical protein EUC41_08400 [Achromobacter denitrificans]|uniref:glycine-rich domain-containing protein n=1 Tax=Achromobacter denitrificans TaxID=32002 RepID=UPI00240D4DA2|nr:hypothetical protein [Achromobacter denitrificans]WFC66338.1 hypothetical protein EUC41_08400 [Achromobacter denitrificans]
MATRIYKTPFAATGDKEALATADQPDGKVSLQAGWTPDYELPNDNANYRPVGRAEMNGILSEVTEGIGEMQQFGFAKWQSIDGGWPLNAHVLHGGTVYRSTTDNNTAEPGPGVAGWVEAASGRLLNVRTFSTAGTFSYTPSGGMKRAYVVAIGGGGAGSGIPNTFVGAWSIGGGGGSGARSERLFTAEEIGASVSVTVGAGGVSNNGVSAVSGATTSFGSLMTAPGGGGGTVSNSPYGTQQMFIFGRGTGAPAGSGGTFNFPGAQGYSGHAFAGTPSEQGPSNGGAGANSPWSNTGGGEIPSGGAVGGAGSAPGAGGAGTSASAPSSGSTGVTARPGGNGAPGMVYIVEYA